jgi:hypothetical protein
MIAMKTMLSIPRTISSDASASRETRLSASRKANASTSMDAKGGRARPR